MGGSARSGTYFVDECLDHHPLREMTHVHMDALPDWRVLDAADLYSDSFSSMRGKGKVVVEFDKQGHPIRQIACVSDVYSFVPPKTWLHNIVDSVSKRMVGDISIKDVQATSVSILVILKLPQQFELSDDSNDTFGLTMVAMNTYNATKSALLGLGSIRFACLNGCIFGDHSKINLVHRGKEGDPKALDDYVHPLIENGVVKAQAYFRDMKKHDLSISTTRVSSDEWTARRFLQDAEGDVASGLMQMDLKFWQKLLIARSVLLHCAMAAAPPTHIPAYDLYNICTHAASHKLVGHRDQLVVRNSMLHTINAAFGPTGTFLKPRAVDKTAEAIASLREAGWEKGWWWSYDPHHARHMGPHQKASKRKMASL